MDRCARGTFKRVPCNPSEACISSKSIAALIGDLLRSPARIWQSFLREAALWGDGFEAPENLKNAHCIFDSRHWLLPAYEAKGGHNPHRLSSADRNISSVNILQGKARMPSSSRRNSPCALLKSVLRRLPGRKTLGSPTAQWHVSSVGFNRFFDVAVNEWAWNDNFFIHTLPSRIDRYLAPASDQTATQ